MADVAAFPGKRLPHNVDAEMALLGAVLLNNKIVHRVSPFLHADHFAVLPHQTIWRAIVERVQAGVTADPISLRDAIADSVPENGTPYLLKVAECAAPSTSCETYARVIVDAAQRRQLIAIGESIAARARDESQDDARSIASAGMAMVDDVLTAVEPASACMDSADLAAQTFPEAPVIINDLIPTGLTLLCAKPKVGKSWMLLDMALAVAGGGHAMGQLKCQKSRAALLMLEDSPQRLKSRILTITAPSPVPRGVAIYTAWNRAPEGVAAIDRLLKDNPEIKFLGIDVLAAFRQPRTTDQAGYATDYEDVKAIQEVAQRRGVAIVVVHHLRKADGEDPLDLVSGTLGITGAVDQIIVITGSKSAGYKLTARGRDLPDIQWDMAFEAGKWTILGDSQERRALDTVERIDRNVKIREMRENGMSIRDIAKEVGVSVGTVHGVLQAGQ